MKKFRILLAAAPILAPCLAVADSTISSAAVERHAYSANAGWTNWNWDTAAPDGGRGAVVTGYFLSGNVYAANFGWIALGDGTPGDGIRYSNSVVGGNSDFGVNHDGEGNLSGLAYGANVGWINFGNPSPNWADPPAIDLKTGVFSGFAYGANIGWIDLGENGLVAVVTESISIGPDTDGDGIADAWEYEQVIAAGLSSGNPATDLMFLSAAGDADLDGFGDVAEFIADSSPFAASDYLQILSLSFDMPMEMAELEWTSSRRRLYELYWTPDLQTFTLELDNIMPDPGSSTIRLSSNPALALRRFWQVRARRPLSP